uniref:Uncharacterized protein n=1 Tax=Sphaerodactylus townsendi TaxID=933632 RepID=A0ACB8FDB4_9SAUR
MLLPGPDLSFSAFLSLLALSAAFLSFLSKSSTFLFSFFFSSSLLSFFNSCFPFLAGSLISFSFWFIFSLKKGEMFVKEHTLRDQVSASQMHATIPTPDQTHIFISKELHHTVLVMPEELC